MVLYTNQRMVIKMSRYIEVNCCGISHLMDYKDEKGLESCMFCEEEQLTYPFVSVRAEIHSQRWEEMKNEIASKYNPHRGQYTKGDDK